MGVDGHDAETGGRRRLRLRPVLASLLGLALATMAGCGSAPPGGPGGATTELTTGTTGATGTTGVAGTAARNGVSVTLRWVPGPTAGDGVLLATFTPDQPGFHLYSLDLPPTGIDGVGRPTSVKTGGTLAATGRPTSATSTVPLRVPGVSVALPVYPDGPVTVRLPAHRTAMIGPAWAVLGYAACSETVCLAPVAGLRVPLALPAP